MIEVLSEIVSEQTLLENRYRILRILGDGATGVVALAEDTNLQQRIALKFLYPHLLFSSASLGRFRNETRVTMSLSHPHILSTFGLGQHTDQCIYIKMEYLEGQSLESRLLCNPPLPFATKVEILRDIASGLEYAHRRGVVHRDLKPANILLDADDRPKIADFGLSQMIRLEARYTGYGEILGTPYYMSPEQIRSETVDARADIYAFGILAFELLTGRCPFDGESFFELAEKHLSAPLPDFEAPTWLSILIHRCTEKKRADRYITMDEPLDVLDAHCDNPKASLKGSQISLKKSDFAQHTSPPLRYRLQQHLPALIKRLCLYCPFFAILLAPHFNNSCRWRYSVITLKIEQWTGTTIYPLRLLLNTPFDLHFPEGYFTETMVDLRQYFRPLLFSGFNPNHFSEKHKTYPLHFAAMQGRGDLLREYIEHGADPNLRDSQNYTALDHAIRSKQLSTEMLDALIDGGADVKTSAPEVVPALAYLLNKGEIKFAEQLIRRRGVALDLPTQLDLPLLHLAIRSGDASMVELLLTHRVNPDQQDSNGRDALEYAKSLPESPEMRAIIERLERHLTRAN